LTIYAAISQFVNIPKPEQLSYYRISHWDTQPQGFLSALCPRTNFGAKTGSISPVRHLLPTVVVIGTIIVLKFPPFRLFHT